MNAVVKSPVRGAQALHGVALGPQLCEQVAVQNHAASPLAASITQRQVAAPPSQPLWRRESSGDRYHSINTLHRTDTGYVISIDCEGRGRFHVDPAGIAVDWDGGTSSDHYLQPLALALWLELRGIPCIHANALAIDDTRAIGLIAPSQGGKSTLSAELLRQGARLMTDDMLALHPDIADGQSKPPRVYPAQPALRLWPSALETLGQNSERHPRVHARFPKREVMLDDPRSYCDSPRELRALFVLERLSMDAIDAAGVSAETPASLSAITIDRLSAAEALITLMQHSMLSDAYGSLGIEAQRAATLAAQVAVVPVYRVRYRSGMDRLPNVAAAVLEMARA